MLRKLSVAILQAHNKKLAVDKYTDSITYRLNLTHIYVICYKQSRSTS